MKLQNLFLLFTALFLLVNQNLSAQGVGGTFGTLTDDVNSSGTTYANATANDLFINPSGPEKIIYLKFTLPTGATGEIVDDIELELRSQSASVSNISVYKLTSSNRTTWTEASITGTPPNAPQYSSSTDPLVSLITPAPVILNGQRAIWYLDAAQFTPGEVVTLALIKSSGGENSYLSQDGSNGNKPRIRVFFAAGSGPTCNDGVMNGNETGIDCGGSDCPACPTCSDGVQNGNETGVDCGGPDCAPCTTNPTCNDGIQNGNETGVDCGGPDCPACPPSCSDGVQNGDETGVDCGGSCPNMCNTGGGSNCNQWNGDCTTSSAIDRTGKVTIGGATDATSNYRLAVSNGTDINFQVMPTGHVYAREIDVNMSNFPDYVFRTDYELMSLDELATYIQKEQHLPGIPSAEDVEIEGIGVGELNLLQMKKIEELTLYVLQLHERLLELEAENAKLKAKQTEEN